MSLLASATYPISTGGTSHYTYGNKKKKKTKKEEPKKPETKITLKSLFTKLFIDSDESESSEEKPEPITRKKVTHVKKKTERKKKKPEHLTTWKIQGGGF